MKPYSSYNDSGVEWIGKIPLHWSINKIKYIFFQRKEKNEPIKTENILSLTIQQGVIPISEKKSGGNKPKEDISKYNLTYPGDIVLNSMNVIVGSVGLSKHFGVVSPVYYILKQINPDDEVKYFEKLFRTEIFQKSLTGLGNGILIKKTESSGKLNTIRMRIPVDKLNQVVIPHPPIPEQKQIISFLDTKTQKIDELIEKTEKKIELLKENRTSLINHCVTKGLNPNVKMKDSGVEWVGEIPSGWDIIKIKWITSDHRQGYYSSQPYDDDGYKVVRITDLNDDHTITLKDSPCYIVSNEEYERFHLNNGDFLFPRTGSIGQFGIYNSDIQSIYGSFLIRFRFSKVVSHTLIKYFLDSSIYLNQLKEQIHGGVNQNVHVENIKNCFIPYPSIHEQLKWYRYGGHLEKRDIETKLIEVQDDNEEKELFKTI